MDIEKLLVRPKKTSPPREYNCSLCEDTQFQEVTQENGASGIKPCVCLSKIRMEYLNSITPAKFQEAELSTIKPIVAKHVKQPLVLEKIRKNPFDSYLFLGDVRVGKTWFGYALFKNAAMSGRRAVAMPMAKLIAEFQRMELSKDDWKPQVTAEDLSQNHTKYTIFIDDIDKSRVSAFTSEKFFDFVNAAYAFGHQLICTSNLTEDNLRKHFSQIDEVWGDAIMRRLTDNVKIVEMF